MTTAALRIPRARVPRGVIPRVIGLWVLAIAMGAFALWIRWTLAVSTIEINELAANATTPIVGSKITLIYALRGALDQLMIPSVVVSVIASICALALHAWMWSRGGRIDASDR